MSWRKYFKVANTSGVRSPISGYNSNNPMSNGEFGFRNYQSNLPEVYTGHPNRIERYNQYEAMDMDSEVNACLDIIAEFSTQLNDSNKTAFDIDFIEKPTDNEIKIINQQLRQWVKLNEFDKRIFKIFRNCIKYGDQVFIRDPETFKLFWVETNKVMRVIVNESDGKKPEQYVVQDINPNFENLTIAEKTTQDFQAHPPSGGYTAPYTYTVPNMPNANSGRFSLGPKEAAIDAEHVVHLSMSEGLDYSWPFGESILEQVFKVFKQKELLEDALLIYRIQRAPERRIFKIDTGNLPSHLAMAFVERVKNEIWQRRIPSQHGGSSALDATYNPMCIDLNTEIPLLDGRKLTLNEIINEYEDGKENWVYSCDPITGKVEPSLVGWAGVTRKNAEVVRVKLDNGESLIVTPDHKFPVLGKGFVEAKDLTVDMSLISHETRSAEEVYDHGLNKWVNIINNEPVENDSIVECHNIIEVEYLDDKMDTGCLTVNNEWHTFATESGVYIKNSMNEDYFFPVTAEGRGSDVTTLPGGQNLGEINDLVYFNNKLARGLKVPSSYLPTGPDESSAIFNDGRVGTALIQEHRFNQYCERLQSHVITKLNDEFKMFLNWRGFNIDSSIFDLKFNLPQNFASSRQAEMDGIRLGNFSSVADLPYVSKRFALKRFLGLTEEEMLENETMWREENNVSEGEHEQGVEGSDLRGVGVTPGGMESDLGDMDEFEAGEEGGEPGPAEVGSPGGAGGAAEGGAGETAPEA